jgi:hypothetical protein
MDFLYRPAYGWSIRAKVFFLRGVLPGPIVVGLIFSGDLRGHDDSASFYFLSVIFHAIRKLMGQRGLITCLCFA